VLGSDATGAPESIKYPTMGEGEVFGELSLLTDGPVTATVRTLTDCVVLGLHRKLFQDLVLSNAEVRAAITELSQRRQQRTQAMTEELSLDDAELIPASELL
jgi:CRP-like cAMP-binding protein